MAAQAKTCPVENCNNTINSGGSRGALGMCGRHYQRHLRHGDPNGGRTAEGEPMAWLERHRDHRGADCLIWPYGTASGYGVVTISGRQIGAHRIMCEMVNGPPKELDEAAHSCGNGHLGCVHPEHLRWDTRSGNFADKRAHGTLLARERHPMAKLSEGDVAWIRSNVGVMSMAEMARRLGVGFMCVSRAAKGKSWR